MTIYNCIFYKCPYIFLNLLLLLELLIFGIYFIYRKLVLSKNCAFQIATKFNEVTATEINKSEM